MYVDLLYGYVGCRLIYVVLIDSLLSQLKFGL